MVYSLVNPLVAGLLTKQPVILLVACMIKNAPLVGPGPMTTLKLVVIAGGPPPVDTTPAGANILSISTKAVVLIPDAFETHRNVPLAVQEKEAGILVEVQMPTVLAFSAKLLVAQPV